MANKVYTEEDIVLQDGTEVTLRPLAIGPLRKFLDAFDEFSKATSTGDGFNVYINCSGIALSKTFKDDFDALWATEAGKKKGEVLSAEYKEHLEGILDLDTIFKILDVCGGIQLKADPKALTEIQENLEELTKE